MLKRVIGIAITVFILADLTGCGGGGDRVSVQPQAGQPRIAAILVDMDGNPVSGAAVDEISGGRIGTTGAQGQFTMSMGSVPAAGATVRLAARKPGYRDGFYTLRVDRSSLTAGVYSVTLRIEAEASSADLATRAGVVLANGETLDVEPVAVTEGGVTFYKTTVTLTDDVNAVIFTTPAQNGDDPDVAFTIGSADGAGANASGVLGKTGAVTGAVSYGDPTDPVALETFPGEFLTESDTGAGAGEGALITAGFTRISLTDANGQPITEFAPGQSATIKMMVPAEVENPETGMLVSAGDTIPVFIFNEDTGEWVVERNSDGSVKRSTVQQDNDGNLFVEFTTTHLSTFNLDWKGQLCSEWGAENADTPVITLLDSSGAPVNGTTVYFSSASGWTHYPAHPSDNTVTLWRAPKDVEWQVWAVKDGLTSDVATVRACKDTTGSSKFTLVFHTEPPTPKCTANSDCDDENPLTYDKCAMPGQPTAVCVNYNCAAACGADTACDDGKSNTTDTCVNAGTCGAYCSHSTCSPACTGDAQCDDGNPLTVDACGNPGTCAAACAHTPCAAACSTHAGCADTNPDTTEKCLNGGTCSASCAIYEAACDLKLDKVNYFTGSTMLITFTGSNAGPDPVLCGAAAALQRGQSPAIWNSFGENLYATLPPYSSSVSQTLNKVIPDSWVPTESSTGSDYDIYTVHVDGAFWTKGDNFNIHVEKPCAVACSTNADCDDGNALTTDSCVSPGACAAACTHNTCPVACAANADCDDSNPLTADTCGNPGTCAAACANTPCAPACLTDANCNDGNALTNDTCSSPNTCAAACVFSPCTPACINNANCDDGNAKTLNICSNPDTCEALCVFPPCTPACVTDTDCDDSNTHTADTCANPDTCSAACVYTSIPNQPPTASASANPTSGTPPLNVSFTGGCADPEGACISYLWDFGDGSPTSSDQNPNHSFTAGGMFTVTLTVTDDLGADAQDSVIITVNQPPTASASAIPASGATPLAVNFTGGCADTDGICVSYDWNFGDGSPTANTQNASHIYTTGGAFSVTLTVTDDEGATGRATLAINVNETPTASASADVTSGPSPLTVNFTGGCTDADGTCVSYLWDFGDGAPFSSLQNPGHTFSNDGIFAVTLTVTDDDGASVQQGLLIIVGVTSGAQIAAGAYHTCALTSSGGVKCWGYNYYGQLGDGTTTQRLMQVHVSGLTSGVMAIDRGYLHTCALTPSGGVKCWGHNRSGQIGDGTTTDRLIPVDVSGMASGVTAMAAGYDHTCALTSSGGVKCWGNNSTGQLGDGTKTTRLTPVDVSGLASGVTAIAAGAQHTCALTTSGGVKCWGQNNGQLGDGTTTNRLTPVNVSGLASGVMAIDGGYYHTCAVMSSGGLKCWGYNPTGALGDGTTTTRLTPVDVSGLTSGVTAITAGWSYTCALTTGGGVKCWGYNERGQLGDGTTATRLTPVDVRGLASGITATSGGYLHTCALTTSGGVKCWGWNDYGQIGDGTTTTRLTPVDVIGF